MNMSRQLVCETGFIAFIAYRGLTFFGCYIASPKRFTAVASAYVSKRTQM
jgi:hypothetical protein